MPKSSAGTTSADLDGFSRVAGHSVHLASMGEPSHGASLPAMTRGSASMTRSRLALVAVGAVLLASATSPAPLAAAATTAPSTVGGARLATHGHRRRRARRHRAAQARRPASYLLADLDTGEVLAAKDPHGRLRPASTLKVLTALTLLPRARPRRRLHGSVAEDANAEGSRVGIVPDATYTVHQLFQGMFLMSGNDAATALANAAGGHRRPSPR